MMESEAAPMREADAEMSEESAPSSRLVDALVHASPLLVLVAVSIAAGQPYAWLALLAPFGPLIAWGLARMGGNEPRGIRSLTGFSLVAGLIISGGWVVSRLGELWPPLSIVFPLGLLALMVGIVNFVLVVIARVIRALRGQLFDYPWVPRRVAGLVGLPNGWEE